MTRSLATKLTLAFLLIGLVGAALVGTLVRWATRTAFDQFLLDQEQESFVQALANYYQENDSWQGVEAGLSRLDGLAGGPRNLRRGDPNHGLEAFTLVGADGKVVYSSQRYRAGVALPAAELESATPIEVDGQTVGWLARSSEATKAAARVRASTEALFLRRLNRAITISAFAASLLALLLGGWLASRMTHSLRELKDATDAVANGALGRQVQVQSDDELGDLAASFNRMSRDLQQATNARRQMTADIAHDLRTPLSVLAGYTEALSDGKLTGSPEVYAVLHQETQYLRRLIDDLRTLSLADAGELALMIQNVPVEPLLQGAAVRHAMAAEKAGVALQVTVDVGTPRVSGDPERLAQVFDNLIRNALRHTGPGGSVRLSARPAPDGRVIIQVQDTGSGIPPEELPLIFNRFYRVDPSRASGGESGLGLAIVKSILDAHGGTITVVSEVGSGTDFTLTLPAAREQQDEDRR